MVGSAHAKHPADACARALRLGLLSLVAGLLFGLPLMTMPHLAAAAGAPGFRPVQLPTGVGYLNAISCPTRGECFVVGQTSGANQRGLVLRLVAGSWQQTIISGASYLTGVSCADATHCAAVGVSSDATDAGAGLVVTTADGSTWRAPAQPPPAFAGSAPIPFDSVSCAGSFCMAVGGALAVGSVGTASEIWTSSGGPWAAVASPVQSGNVGVFVIRVSCTATSDCWIVGQGAWHTRDGGRTWAVHNPPQATGFGLATWSELAAVQFSDSLHGLVAGGDQCGGATDHCPGAVYRTADGGQTWTLISDAATPFVDALWCNSQQLGACVATSTTFTPILPGGARSNADNGVVFLASDTGVRWRTTQRVSGDNFPAVVCPSSAGCIAVGGDQPHNSGAVFAQQPLLVTPAMLSVVATSLPTPSSAFGGVGRAVVNALITLVALVALTFPSQLFNYTFDENYDEILAITGRRFGWIVRARARAATRSSRAREIAVFAVVVVVGSMVGSMRDPAFGFNVRSLLNFTGTLVALLTTATVVYLATRVYRARVHASARAHLRALPAGLAVAAGCVAVSRIAHFQPGYLYGVVCGAVFAGSLKHREQGQLVTVTCLSTVVVAVAAWFAWVPVNQVATKHGAWFGWVLGDDVFASIFVGGITGTVIALLPLRFMPGHQLFTWHRGIWAATFGIATFGLLETLVRPAAGAPQPGNIAWATAAGLFVLFGFGSLVFREFFARHVPGDKERIALAAKVITELHQTGGLSELALAEKLNVTTAHMHATVARLERSSWVRRATTPDADDSTAALHLSSAATALHQSRPVPWVTRRRLVLALTRADRASLSRILAPRKSPEPASSPS
jgi:photosystem II stability/assembly factor-like uncharacterized protein